MGHRTVDISSNNRRPINFAAIKAAGFDAVFIKATDGTGYKNPFYAEDRDAARAAGLLVAGYHFAEFRNPGAEAAFFRSVAGPDAKVLDTEMSRDVAWIDAFLTALNEPADEEMTYGSASALPRNISRGLLWPAEYGPNPGFGQCWQYSQSGTITGCEGNFDFSEWTGTEAQWTGFFGLGPVLPPAPASPTPRPTPPPLKEYSMYATEFNSQAHTFTVESNGALVHRWQASGGLGWGKEIVVASGLVYPQTPAVDTVHNGNLNVWVDKVGGGQVHCWQAPGAKWGVESVA